ncbi:MAG: hypothetical protein GY845_07290 [Planctomycetes bacterium]|nr:hypothetical protein [Planctomycetota bacterium]
MAEGQLFQGWINPLQFLEVDEPWAAFETNPPSLENVIDFICTPGTKSDLESLIARYREISQEKQRLFIAPAEDRILDKLVWPLRNAKASYMVGNYLGTISLCGMVAEMVAILLFEISEFKINNRIMAEDDQIATFGGSFEKLGQYRRVQILHTYSIIDKETKESFDLIRLKRKRYLHLWSQDHDTLASDARDTYNSAVLIVVKAIGQDITDGKINLNPALVKYLQRSGIFEETDDDE